ncbi:MAG TPA: hypothetical protein VK157_04330 [Phycisphaerales bacterium]|nr:hypothetical protein [Phycisphaerales bacterium]
MHFSNTCSFSVVALVVAAAVLQGCSSDGGFFPGTINHNEGAVDYRVVPPKLVSAAMTSNELSSEKNADPRSKAKAERGLVALGDSQTTPYVSLKNAEPVREYLRDAATPQLVEIDNELAEIELQIANRQRELDAARVVEARYRQEQESVARMPDASANLEADKERNEEQRDRLGSEISALRVELVKEEAAVPRDESEIDKLRRTIGDKDREWKQLIQGIADLQRRIDDRKNDLTRVADARKVVNEHERQLEELRTLQTGVQRRFSDEAQKLERTPSVRVTLKQAYLRQFAELGAIGEVAVLVTVKESRVGLGQQEPKAGRVVYYSEGARKQAFMNFRDQPVYGPIRYNGNDLHIRIAVLELDEYDNAVAGAMLKTLASVGGVAYPPSSPVLATLDQIGGSLLQLNGPDLEWDYSMRLSSRPNWKRSASSAEEVWNNEPDSWLRDGLYVLLRSDTTTHLKTRERVTEQEWDDLFLDPRTCVLYQWDRQRQSMEPYNRRSYMVFSVQTGLPSEHLDLAQDAAELGMMFSAYDSGSIPFTEAAKTMAESIKQTLETLQKKQERRKEQAKADATQNVEVAPSP